MVNISKILFILTFGLWLGSCKGTDTDDAGKYKPRWDRVVEIFKNPPPVKISGLFVDGKVATGGDCLTWATACKTVQEAIEKSKGEQIYIAAGTYERPKIEIKNKRNITLIGGYKAGETDEKKRLKFETDEWVVFDGKLAPESLVEVTGTSENIYFSGGFKFINVDGASAVGILGDSKTEPVKNVNISRSQFENNKNLAGDGGGIFAQFGEEININEVDASKNEAKSGGFLAAYELKKFSARGGEWSDNHADSGGALYAEDVVEATLSPAKVVKNTARVTDGGGIYLKNLTGSLADGDVSDNTSTRYGGGIALNNMLAGFTITNTKFSGNTGIKRGGAVSIWGSKDIKLVFNNRKIDGNKAEIGGAIMMYQSTNTVLSQGDFENNTATTSQGGAIFSQQGKGLVIKDSDFVKNKAKIQGGAIFIYRTGGAVVLHNSKLVNNDAKGHGGALMLDGTGALLANITTSLKLTDNTFSSNNSEQNGGGAFIRGVACTVEFMGKNVFEANIATGFGGGLALDAKPVDARFIIGEQTLFKRNMAQENFGGGAIFAVFPDAASPLPLAPKLIIKNFNDSYSGNNAGLGMASKGMIMSFITRNLTDVAPFDPTVPPDDGLKHLSDIVGAEKIIQKFVESPDTNIATGHDVEFFVW